MQNRCVDVVWGGLLIAALSSTPASGEPPRPVESLITATCPAGGGFEGSIHAAAAYTTLFEEPRRKSKLQLQCKSGPAAAFLYDYGDAVTAKPWATYLGARLWGGAEPTALHRDELLMAGGLLVVLSGPGKGELAQALVKQRGFVPYRSPEQAGESPDPSSPPDAVLSGTEDSAALARAFARVLRCGDGDDRLGVWCPVAQIPTAAFIAPKEAQAYPGMSVAIPRGASIRATLLRDIRFSVLVLSPKQAYLQELSPESAEERQELLGGLRAVNTALKLGGKVGPLTLGLTNELQSLRSALPKNGHPLKIDGKRATYAGETPSEIAFIAGKIPAYVVVERAGNGFFISVFPAPAAP